MNSLSCTGCNKITGFCNQYTINGTPVGILFLKVIVRESHIDTNATTTYIRDQLSRLDEFLSLIDYDIGKMNLHVQSLIKALNARGEMTTDLLTNLFKGYKAAIEKKEEYYEEGNDLQANELMSLAKTKWSIHKQKHLWNAPSKQEEKILALKAKVKKLESQHSNKKIKNKSNKGGASASTLSSQNQSTGDGARYDPWMFVPPKDGEAQPKVVGKKQFWWCSNHNKWCHHTTDKCKGFNVSKGCPSKTNDSSQAMSTSKSNKKKQKIAQALGAAAQDEDGR
jgi:polyhydroxyalkanoate synthesis regulator phasin